MNPPIIIFTVILVISIFALPQKYFLVPFIIAACFIPAYQRVIIFDLDFTPLRFCVLFGFLRIILRGEAVRINWGTFDKFILAWAVCGAVIYVLQWGSIQALINRSGFLFDCLGLYWIFRHSVRSWDDIHLICKFFAWFAIISMVLIVYERITLNNPYSIFGKSQILFSRGRWRCSGPFPHSIMMGLFWANLIPFFMACVMSNISKVLYICAIISSLICVILSGSSTPIISVLFIFAAFALYRYRRYGKQIAWCLCLMTLALHIVMKAPVWHLISRLNVFSGSTGWYRYNLINQFIKNTKDWIFLGTKSTAHWGWGLQDITNQYVLEGVRGGLATLIIFVLLLIYAVKIPGSYSLRNIANDKKWLSWGICVSVLGHCISFTGVSYFGQITMLLYLTFAIVGFIGENRLNSVTNRQVKPVKLRA